jgi:hypothetical protein
MSPRTLSPALLPMLQRANPAIAALVEMSVPDQAAILRRAADQLLVAPSLVSITPAASATASPTGGLTLNSTEAVLTSHYTDGGFFNIPQEDGGDQYINTLQWILDPAFAGAILTSFTARLHWSSPFTAQTVNVKLQICSASSAQASSRPSSRR